MSRNIHFASSDTGEIRIQLPDPAATAALGRALARAIGSCSPGALLLYGEMGAGKTALVRALVEDLPGAEEAEVSSPSFTICNIYCTAPEVRHFDLYRLPGGENGGEIDASLAESFEDARGLTIVEWAERLVPADLPENRLRLHLTVGAEAHGGAVESLPPGVDDSPIVGNLTDPPRLAALDASGPQAERCLACFLALTAE